MEIWVRNLTKDLDFGLDLPVPKEELDELLNSNDEYIIISYDAKVLSPGQYDSIDELNDLLNECEEEGISEETLGILSRVLLYHEVIEHVKNGSYFIIDFDVVTNGWNCGNGGNITNDWDKGLCVFEYAGYKPFDFDYKDEMEDWIDWESVWVNATTEGWHEVIFNNACYLVYTR